MYKLKASKDLLHPRRIDDQQQKDFKLDFNHPCNKVGLKVCWLQLSYQVYVGLRILHAPPLLSMIANLLMQEYLLTSGNMIIATNE